MKMGPAVYEDFLQENPANTTSNFWGGGGGAVLMSCLTWHWHPHHFARFCLCSLAHSHMTPSAKAVVDA